MCDLVVMREMKAKRKNYNAQTVGAISHPERSGKKWMKHGAVEINRG